MDAIKKHRQDERMGSRLKQLKIKVHIVAEGYGRGDESALHRALKECMYTLEVLTELPKIEDVEITGPPTWFAECLALCISGQGGSVLLLRWPNRRLKNKKGMPRYKSLRPDDNPSLDWSEFSQRNDIKLPDHMVEFFQQHAIKMSKRTERTR